MCGRYAAAKDPAALVEEFEVVAPPEELLEPERALRVATRLRAGAIHINGGGFNYGSPFGGYKQSGNGREGGMMGLEDYLETKTLHGLG